MIYEVIAYTYFMMSSIHMLLYLFIRLPRRYVFLVLLVAFGGFFFAAYLSVKTLSHRLRQKPLYVFGALAAAFIICFLINIKTNTVDFHIFNKLKG